MRAELYDSPVNTDVTMIAHSADAATTIKRGDDVGVTRAITKMEKLGKTNPNAATRTTIPEDATKQKRRVQKWTNSGRCSQMQVEKQHSYDEDNEEGLPLYLRCELNAVLYLQPSLDKSDWLLAHVRNASCYRPSTNSGVEKSLEFGCIQAAEISVPTNKEAPILPPIEAMYPLLCRFNG